MTIYSETAATSKTGDWSNPNKRPFEFIAVDETGIKLAEGGGGAYSSETFEVSESSLSEVMCN